MSEIFSYKSFYSVACDCIPHFFRYGNSNAIVFACSVKNSGYKTAGSYLLALFRKL